jgi:hypothetical protein
MSDTEKFSSFIENYPPGQESIVNRSVQRRWTPYCDDYQPVKLVLTKSDTDKLNYQFDISAALRPFFVFSDAAVEALGYVLRSAGEFLAVETDSKTKRFTGFYPTEPTNGCFDRARAQFREYPNGLVIKKPVLVGAKLPDRDLFVIAEDASRTYVTSRFKALVESAGLQGFDFSYEVELS